MKFYQSAQVGQSWSIKCLQTFQLEFQHLIFYESEPGTSFFIHHVCLDYNIRSIEEKMLYLSRRLHREVDMCPVEQISRWRFQRKIRGSPAHALGQKKTVPCNVWKVHNQTN